MKPKQPTKSETVIVKLTLALNNTTRVDMA